MTFPYQIRPIKIEELDEAIRLVKHVFLTFEAPDYEQKGIDTFLSFIEIDVMKRLYKESYLTFWGCFDSDRIIGVIAMKKTNHICMLFVDENYHRLGIAKRLFLTAIKNIKKDPIYKQITVHSSPYAVGFYHKIGFSDTNNEKTTDGIRFTPMSYPL